jgi:pterin-4a-carbinolamine dehydratase
MDTENAVEAEAEAREGFIEREPAPRQVEERLKAERVQKLMEALPGWELSWKMQAINRKREFASPQEAACFVSSVARLAAGEGQMVNLFLAGADVMITLVGRPVRGGQRALSGAVLSFAHQIETTEFTGKGETQCPTSTRMLTCSAIGSSF